MFRMDKMYKCKICGKIFKKQQLYASHMWSIHGGEQEKKEASKKISKKSLLQRIKVIKYCEKCGKPFEVERTVNKNGIQNIRKKEKRFCSRSCANSHIQTEKQNKIRSEKLKRLNSVSFKKIKCKICGKEIKLNKYGYCKNCLTKSDEYKQIMSKALKGKTGGYNEGTTTQYKQGRYKGIWCNSSWELAFILYCEDNNINFERNIKRFPYVFNNEKHNYIPDFLINDRLYIEIKGRVYNVEKDRAKYEYFPKHLKIYHRKEFMNTILKEIQNNYGKDFIKLYN